MSFLHLPNNDWRKILPKYTNKQQMQQLDKIVAQKYQTEQVLPSQDLIFNALAKTPYSQVKVVILGQDPYPNANHACGLSFSSKSPNQVPLSLQNIFKERQNDLNIPFTQDTTGDLTNWTKQGVLLLNTTLTVQANNSNSHQNIGWTHFTDAIIKSLNNKAKNEPIVFILWGRNAQAKKDLLDLNNPNLLIIESSHPSPYSASISFFGSKPFSKTNNFLQSHGKNPIDWSN